MMPMMIMIKMIIIIIIMIMMMIMMTDDRISDDDAIVINNNLHEKLSISVKLYDYLSLLYIFVCMFVWIIGAFFQWQF